jgi:GNAT superfamily N-acetyltransferase
MEHDVYFLTPTLTLQRETADQFIPDAAPLLAVHFQEIAHFQDIKLNPQFDIYRQMDQMGVLRVFTLRDRGVLRGYAIFMVRENLHYGDSLQAVQDVLYLDAPLRKQMLGARLIQWCDEELKREGVQVVYHHVKRAFNFGPLLARLGYEEVESIWSRRLDREG